MSKSNPMPQTNKETETMVIVLAGSYEQFKEFISQIFPVNARYRYVYADPQNSSWCSSSLVHRNW